MKSNSVHRNNRILKTGPTLKEQSAFEALLVEQNMLMLREQPRVAVLRPKSDEDLEIMNLGQTLEVDDNLTE